MAKKPKPRRIVIDDIEYRWELRGGDEYTNYEWLGLSVVAATSPTGVKSVLWINLSRSTLILPSYVRRLILEARAAGWNPFEKLADGFRFQPKAGPYADEPDPKRQRQPRPELLEPTPKLEEDLLASIGETADDDDNDDAPRLVYADWLLQRGNLQGEYIQLACAEARGQLSAEQRERMQALFDEHQWKWLGAIGDVTSARRWKRGLVEDVLLDRRARGVVEPAVGDPNWLAVRRVDTRGRFLAASDIARIVGHPVLRNLDALATTVDVLALLVETNSVPDVEELTIGWGTEGSNANRSMCDLLPRLVDSRDSPRRLKRLIVPDGSAREALLVAIAGDPELALVVITAFTNLGEWQDALSVLSVGETQRRELRLARSMTLMFEPVGFDVALRYDERTGRYTHLHVRWTAANDPWARDQTRLGIEQLDAGALTVLSGDGPVDEQWIRALRESAANQGNISFEGILANPQLA
jgi:uncharacterized protein (TIGR02996 family)